MNKQEAINALKEHNQEHVIKRLEALDEVYCTGCKHRLECC